MSFNGANRADPIARPAGSEISTAWPRGYRRRGACRRSHTASRTFGARLEMEL